MDGIVLCGVLWGVWGLGVCVSVAKGWVAIIVNELCAIDGR